MATTLLSAPMLSDWLKGESATANKYSRDSGVIAAGNGVMVTGTVLAKITASGKWAIYNPSASDGSQGPEVGILITAAINEAVTLDSTSADVNAVILMRHAVVSHAGLVWGANVANPAARAVGIAALKAKGIIDRQSA